MCKRAHACAGTEVQPRRSLTRRGPLAGARSSSPRIEDTSIRRAAAEGEATDTKSRRQSARARPLPPRFALPLSPRVALRPTRERAHAREVLSDARWPETNASGTSATIRICGLRTLYMHWFFALQCLKLSFLTYDAAQHRRMVGLMCGVVRVVARPARRALRREHHMSSHHVACGM